jgi:hypothetical protein
MMDRRFLCLGMTLLALVLSAREGSGRVGGPTPQLPKFFDYWGFSIAPEPESLGDELELVGVITPLSESPIPLDFALNEYTVHIYGLRLADRFTNGPAIESHYRQGKADIYADPSFNAPFGHDTDPEVIPPLDPDVVPANFSDGELLVRMEFLSMITVFYPAAGVGSVAYTPTELVATEGTGIGLLTKMNMIQGWHMGGAYTDDPRFIPEGYGMRYDPLIRWENPLPVDPTTWGQIKASFR